MKTAFLFAAILLVVAPSFAAGPEMTQPTVQLAVKEGAIQDPQPATPAPDATPPAPVIRKKIHHPDAQAPAPAAVKAPAPAAAKAPASPTVKAPAPASVKAPASPTVKAPAPPAVKAPARPAARVPAPSTRERLIAAYKNQAPRDWGERVVGIKTHLDTSDKVIALTFDACGGPKGSKIDTALIEFLREEKIPATLFVSGSWINANPAAFKKLAADPLFEIGNHGLAHKPCSVNGKSAYGIKGTANVGELVDEIEKNGKKIEDATGRKPKFYRPGTAYCDEVAVKVAGELGYEVVNYNILGDAGATWPREKVREALLKAEPGSIVIMHMNQPRSQTAAGLKEAVPQLREKGLRFVKLSEYPMK